MAVPQVVLGSWICEYCHDYRSVQSAECRRQNTKSIMRVSKDEAKEVANHCLARGERGANFGCLETHCQFYPDYCQRLVVLAGLHKEVRFR